MMAMDKFAVLSMDIEDWYHLDYFKNSITDKSCSMLDGFVNYADMLNRHNIKTTFFVLSELIPKIKEQILYAHSCGHEIACHGKTHKRPIEIPVEQFKEEIREAKESLSEVVGKEIIGYRAPCYSIDDERYEILRDLGFKYSSSRMNVPGHPLYGTIDLSSFNQPVQGVYTKDGFTEFSLSTKKVLGKHIAVSGGGWIRLFPWQMFMKPLIKSYVEKEQTYTLYIHPFELSDNAMPDVEGASFLTNIRARRGLGKVNYKVEQLIEMLEKNDFKIDTFENVCNYISELCEVNI